MNEPDNDELETGLSKTQLKQESMDLRDLGEKLTTLPASVLDKCVLPEVLKDAIETYKNIPKKHGSRRRQLQFIGKLMRELSEQELQQINAQLHQNVDLDKKRFAELEAQRDRLIAGDKTELDTLINSHPQIDIQHLRQMIRQAQKEQQDQQTPASTRKLFKLLRDLQE